MLPQTERRKKNNAPLATTGANEQPPIQPELKPITLFEDSDEIAGSFKADGVIFEDISAKEKKTEQEEVEVNQRNVTIDKRPENLKGSIIELLEMAPEEAGILEIDYPIETLYDIFPLMNKKYDVIAPGNLTIRDEEKDIIEIKGIKIRSSKRPVRESEYDFLVVSDPKKGLYIVKERDSESAGLYNGTELPGIAKLKEHITKFTPDGWGKSFIYINEGRLRIKLQRVPKKN